MFHLQKNEFFTATAAAAAETLEWARRRLSDASEGLSFDPVPHRYYLHGREMTPVSTIVERFAPFDSGAMAARCAANPRHELYGKSAEEILALWEDKRDRAAEAGTKVHLFAESCCLFLQGREEQIDPQFRDRITAEGFAADEPKEEAVARWWAGFDWTRYAVVEAEARVVNPALGYAGTLDLLLFDLLKRTFPLKDYKTNEDLYKWYGDMMRPPLNMLKANDIGKYIVQQTLYSIQLRNIGLTVDENSLVWVKEDGCREVGLETRYDKVIGYAVSQMKL